MVGIVDFFPEPSDYSKTWAQNQIGRQFRSCSKPGTSGATVWVCTSYDPNQGFWMRDPTDGYETCISERAIGRTFHPVR